MIHHVKRLLRSLNNAKNDADNTNFWSEIAPRLKAIHYEKPITEDELKLAGMKKATQLLLVAGTRKAADLVDASASSKRKTELLMKTRHTRS